MIPEASSISVRKYASPMNERNTINGLRTLQKNLSHTFDELSKDGFSGLFLAIRRHYRKHRNTAPFFDDLRKRFKSKRYAESVVLFRPHGVGDLLMGLSAFRKFRRDNPTKRILLYVYEESASLMRLFDCFDEVISLPRSFDYRNSLGEMPIPKSAEFIDLMVEVSAKTGYTFFDTPENRLHRNDTFSARLGVPTDYEKVEMPIDDSAREVVMRILSDAKIDIGSLVTVTFESMSPNRIWYPPFYKDFLQGVIDAGYTVVLVGNRQTDETLFPGSDRCLSLIGKTTNLNEVAELVRLSSAVISVDTYLCHLAGIMDIPLFGIFTGGVNPDARLCYYGRKEVVTASLACACWDMGCRDSPLFGTEPCKVGITPSIAITAFKEFIQKYG